MKKTFIKSFIIMVVFIRLLGFQVSAADALSQPQTQSIRSTDTIHNTTVQTDSNSSIMQRVEKLEYRLDTETKSIEKRFEDFFKSVTYIVSFLSIFVAFLTIYSMYRGWQQRKDYLTERRFYEQRATNSEELQRLSSVRDGQFATQQLKLGENVLTHSSGILTQQIQNIEKLGAVIDLVRKTFEFQHEREEKQRDLVEQLAKTDKLLDQFKKDFQKKYADAAKLILNFKDVKAMEWPSLPDEAQNIATRSRSKFEDVSSFVLQAEEKKDPYGFAKVLQLIGTSAFYSNDIAFAFDQLHEADRIYQSNPPRPADTLSRAYTKHFLGVAEKNWRLENSVQGSNIEEAHRHLSEAFEVVKEEKRQFLIPVTLAEVLSYRHEQQQEAEKLIDTILDRFDELRKAEPLDANQRSLLVRLYLLKGNLATIAKNNSGACDFYKKAFSEDSNSSFAHLSFAHALPSKEADSAKEHWRKGLLLLDRSGSTKKREITTRVPALVWAVIAAHNCDDAASKENYFKELESTGKNIRSIAHRVPLFFSPLSKELVEFAELKNELVQYLEKSATGSTM